MTAFKLKVGQFVQDDKSKPLNGPDGNRNGRFEKRTFTVKEGGNPQIVESDVDLVAQFGTERFERLDGRDSSAQDRISELERQLADARAAGFVAASPGNAIANPAVAPGGQVSSGFQANGGPLNPEHAERAGVAGASVSPAGVLPAPASATGGNKTGGKPK